MEYSKTCRPIHGLLKPGPGISQWEKLLEEAVVISEEPCLCNTARVEGGECDPCAVMEAPAHGNVPCQGLMAMLSLHGSSRSHTQHIADLGRSCCTA